jgi:beta-glucosidase
VIDVTPTAAGKLSYTEGIHVGYRAWLKAGTKPAYEFGSGLGYTTWTLDDVNAPTNAEAGEMLPLKITLSNTGHRPGKQVVQVYAEKQDSAVDRPARWLVASAPVRADSGTSVTTQINVPTRLLAHWDRGWQYETGAYRLLIGTSVEDLPMTAEINLTTPRPAH